MKVRNVELSGEQIQELFDYVKGKGVEYIDVQYELVDHLASAIEDLMEKDGTLEFEIARYMAYRNMRMPQFNGFAQSMSEALQQQWHKKFNSYLLKFFKFPQIVGTICLTMFTYQFILASSHKVKIIFLLSFIALSIGVSAYTIIKSNRKSKDGKKYLIIKSFHLASFSAAVLLFSLASILSNGFEILNIPKNFQLLFASFVISLYFILFYGVLFEFPKYLTEELNEKYKHLNVVDGLNEVIPHHL